MNLRCLPILLIALLSFSGLEAREVSVKEVTVALHQRPVNGYRMVLDRSKNFVSQQVRKHIGKSGDYKAFEYDRSIIFENILYSPVNDNHKISLYFMLRGLEGTMTELTVVAMYDYKRSISSREFPVMSMNLLADLSALVRNTSGDLITFGEITFDDRTILEMNENRVAEGSNRGDPIEHFNEEEVENNNVLVKENPFEENDGTNFSGKDDSAQVANLGKDVNSLEKREAELKRRETQLIADQQRFKRSQEKLREQLVASKYLQDSIRKLNRELKKLDRIALTSDDVSFTSSDNQQIARMQTELQQKERRQQALLRSNDSLQTQISEYKLQFVNLYTEIEDLEQLLEKSKDDLDKAIARAEAANSNNPPASENERQIIAMRDSLQSLIIEEQKLTKKAKEQFNLASKKLESSNSNNRQLSKENKKLEGQIAQLQQERRALQKEIDAANNSSPSEPRIVYRENTSRLDSLQTLLDYQKSQNRKMKARLAEAPKQNRVLSDSLNLLRQRITVLQKRSGSDSQLKNDLLAAQSEIRQLKNRQDAKKQEQIKLEQDLKLEQERTRQLSKQIGIASNDLSNTQKQLEEVNKRLSQRDSQLGELKDRIKTMANQASANSSEQAKLRDSLRQVSTARSRLESFLSRKNRQYADLSQKSDSISLALNNSRASENRLETRLQLVQHDLDSLNAFLANPNEQTRFIREQWQKLETWESELNTERNDLDNREKLISQKERAIKERSDQMDAQEQKYQQLKEWENQLRIREQKLDREENKPDRGPNPG